MAYNYHQGIYHITNWDKYVGKKNPRYLSSYEKRFFIWADRSPNVIEWAAESVVVPYYSQVKGRKSRYLVDVYIKYYDKDNNVREALIEIKPLEQTKKPKKGNKKKSTYEDQMITWLNNQEKWEAAYEYARERGMEFKVMTEQSLYKY